MTFGSGPFGRPEPWTATGSIAVPRTPDGNAADAEGALELARIAERLPAPQALPAPRSPVVLYLDGLTSEGSRRVQRSSLEAVALALGRGPAEACPWWAIDVAVMTQIRRWLIDRYAPATAARMLAAVRGVMLATWRLELIDRDRLERALDVPPVRVVVDNDGGRAGRALSAAELAELVRVCRRDGSPRGVRDGVLLALLSIGGLRRAEAAALNVDDVELDHELADATIHVRQGKGQKPRTIYLESGGARVLADYLERRRLCAQGYQEETQAALLFPTHNRSGQLIPGRRLTPGAIARVCQRRAAEAGLAATAAHDLRRTSITELLESGADLATASRHAGHANPQTTMRYDRRPRRRQRDAIAKLHFPWF